MGFRSKTYGFDEEVHAALERMRTEYGSPNKGLRVLLVEGGQVVMAGSEEAVAGEVLGGGYSGSHCVHCDREFGLAAGVPPSSLCPRCFMAGHRPGTDCRKCAE